MLGYAKTEKAEGKVISQANVIESYRRSFQQHGDQPEALQWSEEGQKWRFEKLVDMAAFATGQALKGKRILEIGCGLGHFYPYLTRFFGDVDYTGVDIVPELVCRAMELRPGAKFECRNIFERPIGQDFDFVFISGVFNAPYREDGKEFFEKMLEYAFSSAKLSLVFNFTSTNVNFVSPDTNYFDPEWVLHLILTRISKKVVMSHHYKNCDVAVCVSR